MQSFDYQKVYSLQEAFDAASASKGTSVFMAGGTDLLVQIKEGKRQPQGIIDVKGISEMDGVVISGDECFIGALTSIRTLETSLSILGEGATSRSGCCQAGFRSGQAQGDDRGKPLQRFALRRYGPGASGP